MGHFQSGSSAYDQDDIRATEHALLTATSGHLNPTAMLKQLGSTNEEFSYGSTALANSLRERRRVVIAANLCHESTGVSGLSGWECTHDSQGIELRPLAIDLLRTKNFDHVESGAIQLVGNGTRGDAIVVCDPFGDNELLLWALRVASRLGVVTIAITTDQPNLLAALANHAIRVAAPASNRQEYVVSALRHLVQAAGVSLVPARQRATGPLHSLHFG